MAVKLERRSSKSAKLYLEAKIMKEVQGEGIPKIYEITSKGDYNHLVMEILGPNLETLFKEANNRFSLKTILQISLQLIDRLALIHSRNIVHRDIKPENFCIGIKGKEHIIYLIDFGLSKK